MWNLYPKLSVYGRAKEVNGVILRKMIAYDKKKYIIIIPNDG